MMKLILSTLLYSTTILGLPEVSAVSHDKFGRPCYNGKINSDGICICDPDYSAKLCERKKHCEGYQRLSNNSCTGCQVGWIGSECDFIKCEHGIPDADQRCICDQPYSGQHCSELKTGDVYLYYNKKICSMGPLAVLSIIPLISILLGCNWLAKRKQIKKAEKAIEEQFQKDVSPSVIEILLKK